MRSAGARGTLRRMLEPAVTVTRPAAPEDVRRRGLRGAVDARALPAPAAGARRAEERRRIARDLHDGAQQRLVHTIVALKLAQQALDDDGEARALLDEALEQAQAAHTELRQLARGIRPPVLARRAAGRRAGAGRARAGAGRRRGVCRAAARSRRGGRLLCDRRGAHQRRQARAGRRGARDRPSHCAACCSWRSATTASAGPTRTANGLVGLRDRVVALGGEFEVTPARSGGTRIAAAIPLPR